jgi:UDP-glucose 6-dehydrogenase
VLGLAFKPETDDIRESPAFRLIDILLDEEAEVFAYDPIAMPAAKKVFPKEVTFCASLEEALSKAEGVLLVTAWPEFAAIPELLTKLGRDPVFVDGRRQLDKNKIKHYYGIGL